MTTQELFEAAGYFANPLRDCRLEIEAKQVTITNYNPTYLALTGSNIPVGTDSVYVLPNNADKWGREMRIYFNCSNYTTVPTQIGNSMTVGGRFGYGQWNQRFNFKDVIDELISLGFRLGNPQDPNLIRSLVPPASMADFDRGFNAP